MAKVTLLDRHQIAGGYEKFGPGIEPKFVTHADYRALEEELAAYRNLTVEVSVLQDQFSRYADADCRDCDGRGVYYGNVCVCHCVTEKLEDATRTPKEQKK